jgi:hypothetical protein
MPLLSLQNPPMVFNLHFEGLTTNADGLYLYDDFENHMAERIAAYNELTTDIPSVSTRPGSSTHAYNISGIPTTPATNGIVIQDRKKTFR